MADSTLQSKTGDAKASIEQRFREGNYAAFDEVIECYSPVVQRFAYRLLAWNQDVDDVVQDVFVAALAHHRNFRAGSALKTWLFSITINICRSRNRRLLLWRKYTKKSRFPKDAPVNTPTDLSLKQEQTATVQRAARRLPRKYRDVIVLKYLEELPTGEILDILKINEKAFYTRLSRGRNLLQQELSEYMDDENE